MEECACAGLASHTHPISIMARLRVILGTTDFGRQKLAQDKPCHEVLSTLLSRGYTEIDTALDYGNGGAEQIIGRFTAAEKPSKICIATKINPYNPKGLKRESVLEQVHTSLSSLQTSCVDILYLHAPDHNTPFEETLSACQQLHQGQEQEHMMTAAIRMMSSCTLVQESCKGKFKELGLSNFAAWEVADIYHICKRNGWVLPTVYQGMYNAITRMVESELFPALRYFGLRFYAYNPTACGLLTGKYKISDVQNPTPAMLQGRFYIDPKWSTALRQRYWRESTFKGVEMVRSALDEAYGAGKVSMVSAAFRWLHHHSQMKPECNDGVIVGVSCLEYLMANLDACEEGPLDERVVRAYDEAWQLDKANCHKYFR